MTLDDWLAQASADAASRGLPDLRALLEAVARATATLRGASWNHDASGAQPPATDGPADA